MVPLAGLRTDRASIGCVGRARRFIVLGAHLGGRGDSRHHEHTIDATSHARAAVRPFRSRSARPSQHRVEFVPRTAAKSVPTAPNSSHHILFKQLRRLSLQHMHHQNTPFVYDRIFCKMFVHGNFRKYLVVNGLSDKPSSCTGVYRNVEVIPLRWWISARRGWISQRYREKIHRGV